jgi:SDR family mycofactocin-dependent oxidoreductase
MIDLTHVPAERSPDEHRVALVTGAARGVGAATVHRLAVLGYRIVAVDVCEDDPALPYPMGTALELADVVESAGHDHVVGFHADVRDVGQLAFAVELAESRFGRLDVAVAGAGVIAGGVPLEDLPADAERAVLEVDLGGVVNLARVALPALKRAPAPRSGRFIAIASAAATRGLPMLAAYCAAKSGVAGLIRSLGTELRGDEVTANAVSPGSTDTPILAESARLYGLSSAKDFAHRQPLDRLLDPDEVAAVIAFLAGPESSAMTGSVIPVDGGLAL